MELNWGPCPVPLARGVHCPSIPVTVLPSFWDAWFLGAVVLGWGWFRGADGSWGRGLPSQRWLLGSVPVPLGAREGSGVSACS